MDDASKINETANSLIENVLTKFSSALLLAFIAAIFMHDIWIKQLNIYHTILELICIFMALSVFWAVWYNYKQNNISTVVLAFGFLTVAVFDGLHSFYFLRLELGPYNYFDLSAKFWILGRFAQAFTIIFYTIEFKNNISKWLELMITIFITCAAAVFIIYYGDYLPVFLTEKGVTPLKIVLEYIIIVLFASGLYRLKNKKDKESTICYTNIWVSFLIMVPAEILFTLYSSVTSVVWTVGHVLKIISYYFLFKAVVENTFVYSYRKLEKEHKALEEAVKDINNITQTLGDILEAMPFAVLMYDDDSRIKYINSRFEEIFQCIRTDLYGLPVKELLKILQRTDDDKALLPDIVLKSDGNDIKTVATYKLPNGEVKKVSITSRKIQGGAISLIREAKEEQALSNLNLQTETILDAVSSGVLMIDNNKRVVLCNKAFEELVEINKKDIIGMNIDELNNLIKYTGGDPIHEALKENHKGKVKEGYLTTLNGNFKELNIYTGNIKNVDGEIIGAISVSTDITEVKKEQIRIREQEKLALLGQLSASIVHETRNFLTTIKGRCQLIEVLAQDENIKKHAAKIDKDVNEINGIIGEFLFLSKPRKTEFQEVSMFDIFQSVKNIVETSSLVKGINVNMVLSKEERYLLCDEVQIKQIILNICKNAVDAMSGSENPRLDIETGYDEGKNEMFIKISDNGKGMTKETLERLGTMFYSTKKSGTGLGLNVCYQIIKEHKGRIEVESTPLKGSSFKIILPCIEDIYEEEEIIDSMQ